MEIDFESLARRVRRSSLEMVHRSGLGHPGGDLSAAEILTTLYFGVLRVDPKNPAAPHRDRFILSKGHCSASLYSTLAFRGFFPESDLKDFMEPLSPLNGHPNRTEVPGVEANTGPLGHGFPIAAGAAMAAKMDGAAWRTFVLTGDGELQEGSNWEAIMAAAQYRLDNLIAILDRNRIQQGGETERIVALDPLPEKFRAFGWAVREVDGHDCGALLAALQSAPFEIGRPSCIIANTTKGKGVSFMENRAEWHHGIPNDAQLTAALQELERGFHG